MILSPWYQHVFRHVYKHPTSITNENGPIKSQCFLGRRRGQHCHQSYSKTIELPVGGMNHIICWLFPVLYCSRHDVYSYLVGQDDNKQDDSNNFKDRGPLFIHPEDTIVNPPGSWSLYPFNTKPV